MRNSLIVKFSAVVLIALFVHAPSVFASCTRQQQFGQTFSLVYDYTFDEGCDKWVTGAYAEIVSGYPGNANFPSYGQIYQDIVVPHDFSSYSLSFQVQVNGSAPGPEQLHVKINGTDVAIIGGNHADGRYDVYLDDIYDNQTITLTVERPWVRYPGDTEYVLEWIEMWGTF
jgi:ribulose 1,5-bisphosphate carboxylase large subunit-like protein